MQTSISYTPKSSIRFNYETLCFNFVFELSEENIAISSILEEIIKKKILFNHYYLDNFQINKIERLKKGNYIVIQVFLFAGVYKENSSKNLHKELMNFNYKLLNISSKIEQRLMENVKTQLINNVSDTPTPNQVNNNKIVIQTLFPNDSYNISHLPTKNSLMSIDWTAFQQSVFSSKKIITHVGNNILFNKRDYLTPNITHTPFKFNLHNINLNRTIKHNSLVKQGKVLFLSFPPNESDGGIKLQILKFITHQRLLKTFRDVLGFNYDVNAIGETYKNFIIYEMNFNEFKLPEEELHELIDATLSQKISLREYKEALSNLVRQIYEISEDPYLMSDFLFNQCIQEESNNFEQTLIYLKNLDLTDVQIFFRKTKLSPVFVF